MKKILSFLATFETQFSYALVVLLTALLSVQIVNRYVFHTSFVWLEETIRISFVWLIYFSVASAARENRHVRVAVIDLLVPPAAVRIINRIADALVVGFSLLVVWLGVLLIQSSIRFGDRSPVTEIPMSVIYAVVPICFALIAIRIVQFNFAAYRGRDAVPNSGAE